MLNQIKYNHRVAIFCGCNAFELHTVATGISLTNLFFQISLIYHINGLPHSKLRSQVVSQHFSIYTNGYYAWP